MCSLHVMYVYGSVCMYDGACVCVCVCLCVCVCVCVCVHVCVHKESNIGLYRGVHIRMYKNKFVYVTNLKQQSRFPHCQYFTLSGNTIQQY